MYQQFLCLLVEKKILLKNIDLLDLFGEKEKNLKIIRSYFSKLKITHRGEIVLIKGKEDFVDDFYLKFNQILNRYKLNSCLQENDLHFILNDMDNEFYNQNVILNGPSGLVIKAKTKNQNKMLEMSSKFDLLFVYGPAGTGKTYTSVAIAVKALKNKEVKKIILTRPAVESGENLGFLPGDLKEKLDPYMSPLYDALSDMIPPTKLKKLLHDNIIEIAPLAFMRGRTLNKSFIILDEAQNTLSTQMKMFLTRLGQNSKMVITGDLSQKDLPDNAKSGMQDAMEKLEKVKDIGFVHLNSSDVCRHTLVEKIINAYDK